MMDEQGVDLPMHPVLRAAVVSPRMALEALPKLTPAAQTARNKVEKPRGTKRRHTSDKPGPDGTVYQARRLRTGTTAIATMNVRCRPGTFEWRYGRHGNSLYHAGTEYALLWERAGIAFSGYSDPGGSGGGGWKGDPDARLVAMQRVKEIDGRLGGPIVRRLVAYCVEGRTPREIAGGLRRQATERQMAAVLDQDLSDLAHAMGYAA